MSSHWSLPPSQWNCEILVVENWLIGWLLTIPDGTLLSPLSQVVLHSNSRKHHLDTIKHFCLINLANIWKSPEGHCSTFVWAPPPRSSLADFVTFSGCRQLHLTVTVSKEYGIFCTLVKSKCAKLAGFTWTSRAGLVGKTWVPLCDSMISDPLWHYDLPISFNICRESTLLVINQFVCGWPEKQPWQVERLVSGRLRTMSAKFILPLAHLNTGCISCVFIMGI